MCHKLSFSGNDERQAVLFKSGSGKRNQDFKPIVSILLYRERF